MNDKIEKLNLWDRIFNRYKKEIHKRGKSIWCQTLYGSKLPNSEYVRSWVEYLITDRVTGSQTIEKEYLD